MGDKMIFGDFSEWTAQNLIIRVIASMILGGIIGLDRGMKHRGAGTKTMTVVCLGATLVMLTEQYIQIHFPGLANMNRLAAQVISGVGFLGVGTIIISNHRVRGLTTAATLWASATIGLGCGNRVCGRRHTDHVNDVIVSSCTSLRGAFCHQKHQIL